jgi:hypothetical protein
MMNILTKSRRNKDIAKRAFSSFASAQSHYHPREYPELDQSYMKIVGGEVDTFSADF